MCQWGSLVILGPLDSGESGLNITRCFKLAAATPGSDSESEIHSRCGRGDRRGGVQLRGRSQATSFDPSPERAAAHGTATDTAAGEGHPAAA